MTFISEQKISLFINLISTMQYNPPPKKLTVKLSWLTILLILILMTKDSSWYIVSFFPQTVQVCSRTESSLSHFLILKFWWRLQTNQYFYFLPSQPYLLKCGENFIACMFMKKIRSFEGSTCCFKISRDISALILPSKKCQWPLTQHTAPYHHRPRFLICTKYTKKDLEYWFAWA